MNCCRSQKTCFVCSKIIQTKLAHVQCVRCNIRMHETCYTENKRDDITYTECNSCKHVGSIGINVKFITPSEHL